MFDRGCIFIHGCFSIVMLVNSGEYAPKINMEPKNGGLEDYFPFQLDDF